MSWDERVIVYEVKQVKQYSWLKHRVPKLEESELGWTIILSVPTSGYDTYGNRSSSVWMCITRGLKTKKEALARKKIVVDALIAASKVK
jgi:hypothetical protein